ncbi:MAG TPA: capsular biosynthesis protein [Ottowia sp.]|uniref:tyrosine-protein phosphatase n=1 Tax=Ottowia sp. TaxID=1898956 RepID=UPI002C3D69A6|nr:CpsB/CapC family capsule biosynthesis tyrosine phosphatase [Ottowia sp.]HMN20905.1 capsular biosynthesis protein [Ottowia sp.]
MIDLHTHLLPGIDDGADSLETALEMARIAVQDGTTVLACTPHIYPGLYMNDAAGIGRERDKLQAALDTFGIPLRLTIGADAHLVPELLDGLQTGRVPTLAGSRYFLLEPAHHVAPPGFEQLVLEILLAGYVPVITHPERLTWIEDHYPSFVNLACQGCWLQLTAGSIVGKFGKRARYWSERLLDEGMVHIVASDAHTTGRRSPRMSDAIPVLERHVGAEETRRLLEARPQAILDDRPVDQVAPPPGLSGDARTRPAGRGLARLRRLLARH